jgi:hypothetical protein
MIDSSVIASQNVSESSRALTLQLLEWITARPRTHEEALEVWRTTCPRLSIWEDACIEGLIDLCGVTIVLSRKGARLLEEAHEDFHPG